MQDKRRALGRGLDELGIGDLLSSIQDSSGSEDRLKAKFLNVDMVTPNPYQPRKHFSATALKQLADSIKAQGLLQPIVVRAGKSGGYELIAGERRLRACQSIGMKSVPAIVKNISDQACLVLAVIENIQRQDLNVLELAESLQSLASKYGMTHAEVGGVVGKSRAAVSNLIRLLQLNDDVKKLLIEGLIEMGHARCLLSLPSGDQLDLAKKIMERQLPVREVEEMVRGIQQTQSKVQKTARVFSENRDVSSLKQLMSRFFGAKVQVKPRGKEGGVVSFSYQTEDELKQLMARIEKQGELEVVV